MASDDFLEGQFFPPGCVVYLFLRRGLRGPRRILSSMNHGRHLSCPLPIVNANDVCVCCAVNSKPHHRHSLLLNRHCRRASLTRPPSQRCTTQPARCWLSVTPSTARPSHRRCRPPSRRMTASSSESLRCAMPVVLCKRKPLVGRASHKQLCFAFC